MNNQAVESEMSSYVGKLLRDHFGKGPSSVYVTLKGSMFSIHLREFLAPMERVLLKQERGSKVEESRDILMEEILPEMKAMIRIQCGVPVQEIFYDWSLENRSGIIIGTVDVQQKDTVYEDYDHRKAIHEEIATISRIAERQPDRIDSFYMNDRTLVVIRSGILVRIEQELIKEGYIEQLKLTKRKLEKGLLHQRDFKQWLGQSIEDIYVDWDFDSDRSYIVFVTTKK